ncbi:MAG: 3'(2'),5'-bisphosphate nucleotidase CysQ [Dermatophilaceae bacterium]|uniref:3'(2'),5-bisphosphonucleoside 3'(2')-phosphohydrolase n=1 Tax=Nostocoides jenkinsii Ben 74 TaxID=1193518 RepID=A0A077MBJ7_9MICO|nr:3'(2'),5'-bisphosphate nucleotidase CysQ [Tetrasphaera jenkinsii]CCI52028.1 putative enzyme [Tetrasphaera jenkinsii Ben 74]
MADPRNDHILARDLAVEAGKVLLAIRADFPQDGDPKALRDAGDRGSHDFLMDALAQARPDDAVLSEEGADNPVRLRSERVWIVDPLDGTREFSERPRDDWAVHVALWERGELVAGAVALPARDQVFSTDAVPAIPEATGGPIRLAVSRSRPPAWLPGLVEALDAELVPMGSAGVKAVSVLDGSTDAYVHAGGQYEWDSAAPVVVAAAAGLFTSRVDGSKLLYNQPNVSLPDLIVCRPELAEQVLAAVATLEF